MYRCMYYDENIKKFCCNQCRYRNGLLECTEHKDEMDLPIWYSKEILPEECCMATLTKKHEYCRRFKCTIPGHEMKDKTERDLLSSNEGVFYIPQFVSPFIDSHIWIIKGKTTRSDTTNINDQAHKHPYEQNINNDQTEETNNANSTIQNTNIFNRVVNFISTGWF
jgi:hypothetical protein